MSTVSLTATELEILRAAAAGEQVATTARRTNRSVETIKSHRKRILLRLRARNITQAVAVAYAHGILGDRPPDRPITPGKRDALHAKAGAIDRARGDDYGTRKRALLAEASERFGRPITSANHLSENEARELLDQLEHELRLFG